MSRKVPFGYKLENDDQVKVNEDEAMLVREIFRLFIKYQSVIKVTEGINNSDLFPENKHRFNAMEISSMLKNYFYTGNLFYDDVKDNKTVIVAFSHQGIVPSEVWDKVQELLIHQGSKVSNRYTH
ncbi:recombinase family protein [Virgibacillus sp. W0430]|uniref:recombinase family protein n=1 Tax=Virgibacillus sp. W0430 TaxID=3391580 RepID=UPI003F48CFE8